MNIVCNSPKFEVSSEQSSYFNLHIPGTYISTPAVPDNNNNNNNNNDQSSSHSHSHSHSQHSSSSSFSYSSHNASSPSSTSKNSQYSTDYFTTKPMSSPAQTPYFDALTSPFINHQHNNTNNGNENMFINKDQLPNQQHKQQLQYHYKNAGVFTPSLFQIPNISAISSSPSSSSSYFPPQLSSSISLSFPSSLSSSSSTCSTYTPSSSPQKRLKNLDNAISNKKPHSMPSNLPSGNIITINSFHVFSHDTVANLLRQSDNNQQRTIMLLDIRPFSSFSNDRIKHSLNICVPSTLTKRPSFTVDNLLKTLVNNSDKQMFKEWHTYENIVLYDNDTAILSENSSIYHICKKFVSPAAEKKSKVKIGFLKGGFVGFSSKFFDLCEKMINNNEEDDDNDNFNYNDDGNRNNVVNNNNSCGTFPRKRSLFNRKPGPFTCPTPIVESSYVNYFFTNIRQNIELSVGITETIPVRIPTQKNLFIDQSKLPLFIREVAFKDNGRMKLAEMFHDIEKTEQNRLKSLMIENSNMVTLDNPYSISAGIEKGTKNRYENIWPYDHARVKINECKEGDCDYVNASFLQAKGCNKRYIATQGPLPSTYEDFWKVVWEQNSRLIVMLTKEEEAGRIQCHRYWSESFLKPCSYGPLDLVLISESSTMMTSTNNNINNNDSRFPSIITDNNTIIIRKFKLSHRNYPNLPPREVTQLHFLGWPDFGTPETPINILKLIDMANNLQSEIEAVVQTQQCQQQQIGPMVVHCSAGCGRTGTFCTIDTALSILSSSTKHIDDINDVIQNAVLNFREQRLSIVQNLRQFVFCYEAVLWKLCGVI